MRDVFHHELDRLAARLVDMTDLVGAAMGSATRALLEADLQLAEAVIAADAEVDDAQRQLDEQAVEILARQSPVATDLRTVVASLRMSSSLERMGDLARHVAALARLRYPRHAVPEELVGTFARMGEIAQGVASTAGEVIRSRDLEAAAQLERDDDVLDELHRAVFAAVSAPGWTHSGETTADVTLTSRYFERYGDHAVSLAHRVVFLVTGDWRTHSSV
ncbi:phosphate signaling complex protein PhoU [Quadrisphaera sp. DSM 44207]|uniref:phosphate signaling complex protein PhoU n=1 Tax=Quadrisphaera sp. DSM 44207 TaxID=1881057 RepID=UPI00088E05D1|nr:phosphate signaling complex protein PhoU [Quadrisphaera sp. DSM 44207]SDQ62021.1 phosphate uptake regulator, PhoU [Quadrisphaera sp. DSM 44207]